MFRRRPLTPLQRWSTTFTETLFTLNPIVLTLLNVQYLTGKWDSKHYLTIEASQAFLETSLASLPKAEKGEALSHRNHLRFLEQSLVLLRAKEYYYAVNSITSPVQMLIRDQSLASPLFVQEYIRVLREGLVTKHVVSRRAVLTALAQLRTSKLAPELATFLEQEYLPSAVAADAVGTERYRRMLTFYTGSTQLDLAELYAYGEKEIRRLHQEITALLPANTSLVTYVQQLAKEYSSPNAEHFFAFIHALQQQAFQQLAPLFTLRSELLQVKLKTNPVPGATAADYHPPPENEVWYPAQYPRPLYDQVSTAYHEAFPGHCLHLGMKYYNARLTAFEQKLFDYPSFSEGWALYAEKLMREQGFYKNPVFLLGSLCQEMFRACRVVIDIGLHTRSDWSFETGVRLLVEHAGLSEFEARDEVTRYATWPAQAVCYKLGEREILALRARLVGPGKLTLRQFHDRFIRLGVADVEYLRGWTPV